MDLNSVGAVARGRSDLTPRNSLASGRISLIISDEDCEKRNDQLNQWCYVDVNLTHFVDGVYPNCKFNMQIESYQKRIKAIT